jgi:hypothetical protein
MEHVPQVDLTRVKMTNHDPATATVTYRTAALIAEPSAVWHLNWLLGLHWAGVIDRDTLGHFIADEIQAGSMQTPCWESVEATLTGRELGYCVEVKMQGIEGAWWVIQNDIIPCSSVSHPATCQTARGGL